MNMIAFTQNQREEVRDLRNIADALKAEPGSHLQTYIALENHPTDSRVKINELDVCETLTSRMGTGGGNVPLIMELE